MFLGALVRGSPAGDGRGGGVFPAGHFSGVSRVTEVRVDSLTCSPSRRVGGRGAWAGRRDQLSLDRSAVKWFLFRRLAEVIEVIKGLVRFIYLWRYRRKRWKRNLKMRTKPQKPVLKQFNLDRCPSRSCFLCYGVD